MYELNSRIAEKLDRLHALLTVDWPKPELARLSYRRDGRYFINESNTSAIEGFIDYLSEEGSAVWVKNPDAIDPISDDVTIATVDRYGFPLRSVYSKNTGLLRSDPYYHKDVVEAFYTKFYRGIYSIPYSVSSARFFSDQVAKGARIYDSLLELGIPFRSVLDYGCGMGGMLIPFKQADKRCLGCDLGEEYLKQGRTLGLSLVHGGTQEIQSFGPFDLIILSHVLEHITTPESFLHSMLNLLQEGGHLVVEVPGVHSIPHLYHGDILRYLQNAHVWHFTRPTLVRLLCAAGFEIVHVDDAVFAVAKKSKHRPENKLSGIDPNTDEFLKKIEAEFIGETTVVRKVVRRYRNVRRALFS